jgi:uncharacterized membrane protein YjfL (UPF0719 family)
MLLLLQQYLITFGWALTGAISVAISIGISLKIYDWLTPIDEWEEVKKGNIGVSIIISSIIIGTSLVIALSIMP